MCFPEHDISGLVWIWAIPLMIGLWSMPKTRRHKLKGFTLAYLCGLTFWLINLWWLLSMKELEGVPVAGAYFSWVGMAVYLSLYFGIWGAVACSVGNPWRKVEADVEEKKSRVDRAIEKKLAVSEARSSLALGGKKKFDLMSGFGTSLRVMRFAFMHASLWVVLEWLRGWLAQAADLVGATGLSFLPMLVCSMMVQLGARLIEETKIARFKAHWEIAFTVGLVSLAFVYGILRMGHFRSVETHPVKVMILQENIKQSMKWGDDKQQLQNYENYAESLDLGLEKLRKQSFDAAMERMKAGPDEAGENTFHVDLIEPDVVILPESAFTQNMYFIEDIDTIFLSLYDDDFLRNGLLAKGEFSVIYGSNLFEAEEKDEEVWPLLDGTNYNSLAIAPPTLKHDFTNPTQQISAYGKIHLVPFGEYFPDIPFRETIYSALSGSNPAGDFSPGTSYEPLQVIAGGRDIDVIPAICFEDTVARVTHERSDRYHGRFCR